MSFKQDLKDLIETDGLTQKEIAARVGVSQTMVSRYLRGVIPTQKVRMQFYRVFHLTTSEEEREIEQTQGHTFLTVEEAARLLQVSTETVRAGLRQKELPIGCAVHMKEWRYIIPKKQFAEFTGIQFEED